LLRRLDAPHRDTLSLQLLLLVDGAIAGALVRGEPKVARAAREAARVLLSASGIHVPAEQSASRHRASKQRHRTFRAGA
jgi:hypothetical protein